jgi:hypothetical protein
VGNLSHPDGQDHSFPDRAVVVTLYVSDGIGDYMFEFSESVHQFPYGQCAEFDQPAMADGESVV